MSNSEVLARIVTGRDIWKAITKRKVRIIEYNLRHAGMVSLILERMIEREK